MRLELRRRAIQHTNRMRTYRAVKGSYHANLQPADIVETQLNAFNNQWRRCISTIPFYREWAADNGLPRSIRNLEELASFPVLTKSTIRDSLGLICEDLEIDGFYSTGGSSGTPVKFPKSNFEDAIRYADIFTARSWIGIEPGAKYVHLWGHSHLYGSGTRAIPTKMLRLIKDWLSAGVRLNAYDLSTESNERYARIIESRRPEYLIGYTSALVRVADAAKALPHWNPPPSLRAVIVTAETVSEIDLTLIESVFRAPCYIEYGAAETGVIAHSTSVDRRLRVLWSSHVVTTNANDEARISTIQERAFPLINYEIGDRVEPSRVIDGSVLEIEKVEGRAQEAVLVPTVGGGHTQASAIMLVHVCKAIEEVNSVQVFNGPDKLLYVFITASRFSAQNLSSASIVRELTRSAIDADVNRIRVLRIPQPILSTAGKVRVLLTDDEGAALLKGLVHE